MLQTLLPFQGGCGSDFKLQRWNALAHVMCAHQDLVTVRVFSFVHRRVGIGAHQIVGDNVGPACQPRHLFDADAGGQSTALSPQPQTALGAQQFDQRPRGLVGLDFKHGIKLITTQPRHVSLGRTHSNKRCACRLKPDRWRHAPTIVDAIYLLTIDPKYNTI